MAKYIMIYKNDSATDMSAVPKEQFVKMMEMFGEWLGRMGSAVIDKGDAFKTGGKSITPNGVVDADNLLSGYSIIDAKNFDEALSLAQGNPMVAAGAGTVELYEAFGG
jgi:hypothetical protein